MATQTTKEVDVAVQQAALVELKMSGWKKLFHKINRSNGIRGFGKYHVANFFFLLVLMGTEMDMAGLFFSAPIYMAYDPIYQYLIVIFGLAFVLPLLFVTLLPLAACCINPDATGDSLEKWAGGIVGAPSADGGADDATFLSSYLKRVNPHGGNMSFYHWVPCLRFYLIVKHAYTPTDVDAVFKVNSISSFSLGVFQLIGILATFVLGKEITLYVKINIVTQCLNWFITFCYFSTPVPNWMAVGSQAKTLSRHFQGILANFANESAKEVAVVIQGDVENVMGFSQHTRRMKCSLAKLLSEKFLATEDFAGSRPCADTASDAASVGSRLSRSSSGSSLASGEVALEEREKIEKRRSKEVAAHISFEHDMATMRDIDVKEFLVILRNQIMSTIDVKGGL